MIFSSSINLLIIFLINQLVVWSIKCQKMVKNDDHLEPQVESSSVLFCPDPQSMT